MDSAPKPVASSASSGRLAEWTAALGGAVLLAAVTPLGLAAGAAADQVAPAFGVRRPFAEATPLADLLVRFFALLPAGEAGTRGHAVAGLAGVVAVALLLARLRLLSRAGRLSLGTLVGVTLLMLSRPFLEVASTRPAEAVDLCLLAALILGLESIRRDPAHSARGLGLAFLCGLAAAGGWPLRVAAWPAALVLTAWALRRGHRWPLLSPTLFVAGAAVTLAGVVSAAPSDTLTVGTLLHQVLSPGTAGPSPAQDLRALLAWVVDDVGVLGLLMGAIGCALMLSRGRKDSLLVFGPWSAAVAAALWVENSLLARLFIMGGLVMPVVAAATFFAESFGRARAAVALALAVIVVFPPALVGLGSAAARPGRAAPGAVSRRLDLAFQASATAPDRPWTGEAAHWWRYGTAIGLAVEHRWSQSNDRPRP